MLDLTMATASVIKVGGGRGFVVEGRCDRLVITAAHCLPDLPPAMPDSSEDRTFKLLLGPLDAAKQTISAKCLFVDPVSDIAILGPPDGQAHFAEHDAYQDLVGACDPIWVGRCQHDDRLSLLSLDGKWHSCRATQLDGGVWFTEAVNGIRGGMSGSPAINSKGEAVALVSLSWGNVTSDDVAASGGPNPNLAEHLPRWAADELLNAED